MSMFVGSDKVCNRHGNLAHAILKAGRVIIIWPHMKPAVFAASIITQCEQQIVFLQQYKQHRKKAAVLTR